MMKLRAFCAVGLMAASLATAPAAWADPPQPKDPWPGLADDIFKGRPIEDGTGLLALELPYRAEDAATVPVTVRATLPAGDTRRVTAFTLVIDENPAPVAGTFEIGPKSGVTAISTRVRIDSYTNVHAVAAP